MLQIRFCALWRVHCRLGHYYNETWCRLLLELMAGDGLRMIKAAQVCCVGSSLQARNRVMQSLRALDCSHLFILEGSYLEDLGLEKWNDRRYTWAQIKDSISGLDSHWCAEASDDGLQPRAVWGFSYRTSGNGVVRLSDPDGPWLSSGLCDSEDRRLATARRPCLKLVLQVYSRSNVNYPKFAQTQSLRTNFDTLSSDTCNHHNGRVNTRQTRVY